jgi:hypothetical protein
MAKLRQAQVLESEKAAKQFSLFDKPPKSS